MELEHYKDYIDIQLTEEIVELVCLSQLPFIGDLYKKSKEKVMLIGKSGYNYAKDNDEREKVQHNHHTINTMHIHGTLYNGLRVNDWELDEEKRFKKNNNTQTFNRGVEKIFFRKEDILAPSFENKRDKFWKSIVHTQLIPRLMKSSPHIEIDNEAERAIKTLINMIEILKPKHVVLMSNDKNYQNLLSHELEAKHEDTIWGGCGNSNIWSTEFKLKNGDNFNFIQLLHPSYRGYKKEYPEYQNDLLQKVMPIFLKYLNAQE